MDLLEYQAKELFREVGIPVLPAQKIADSREIKQLHVSYPIVLKSQVRSGGRAKAGGIRFVENTIDAIAAAQTILNLPISGEYPQLLLAEARYQVQREIFLAIVLDYQLNHPILLGSAQGGIQVEDLLDSMHTVVIDGDFSPFYARRLAIQMGLEGEMIRTISNIVEKMYALFLMRDLDSIEINPLGIDENGNVMALDGKIALNNRALVRHPDLVTQFNGYSPPMPTVPFSPQPEWLNWNHSKGKIGLLSNSTSLSATIWDLLSQQGAKPRNCLVIGSESGGIWFSDAELKTQLEQAFNELLSDTQIKVVLLHLLGVEPFQEVLLEIISRFFAFEDQEAGEDRVERPTAVATRRQGRSQSSRNSTSTLPQKPPALVFRCCEALLSDLPPSLNQDSIYCTANLDEAITQTLIWAK
ncbi:acetate--CoA ligase family protein [Spirulina sp. CS-785/01]|uniref:ATP-grasp domain-containing protein n=1 Tax=Spirulina sp. CS-785/01 TaxID=3021716 RepID=UPI00232F92BD|nr:ATP-grasp domain-containing protein [Spirulina sp. CS-785/01]MDB9312217.1 acetate--CoA ligase family protein [Spirulina sp. CS-785/01]